jgi:hypothetical protein
MTTVAIHPNTPHEHASSSSYWAFDIETMGQLPHPSSRHALPAITCACLYNGSEEHALSFHDVSQATFDAHRTILLDVLDTARLLIGFNAVRFDLVYIQRFFQLPTEQLQRWIAKTLDPYVFMKEQLHMTCSLGTLLAMNHLPSKSASGLQAIVWAKQRRMDLVLDYCMMDTKLTYALCCSQPTMRIHDVCIARWSLDPNDQIAWSSERLDPPSLSLLPVRCFLSTEHLLAEGHVCVF